jgi:hypothetical protein
MTCNNDGCWYQSKPIEQYYFIEHKIESIDCSFTKKQVIAQFENSQLYPSNECRARNLECKLYDSIIVWINSSKNEKRSPHQHSQRN